MKLLLKLIWFFIYKFLGIIYKSLVFGKILDNRVLIGIYYKIGIVWMFSVFNFIVFYYDLKFYVNRGNKFLICLFVNFDIFF